MALLCAEFVRRFRTIRFQGVYGRIINLSSGQGLAPMADELAYAATKGRWTPLRGASAQQLRD